MADDHPVLFVMPDVEGGVWWVQPAVEDVNNGEFSGLAQGDPVLPRRRGGEVEGGRGPVQARADERPPPKPRTVRFADRTWEVKAGKRLGPGPNEFSDAIDNVRVDKETR